MGGELQQLSDFGAIVVFVQAHALRMGPAGPWPGCFQFFKGLGCHFEFVAIGAAGLDGQQKATGIGQQAAFGSLFGVVCGVGPVFPHPREP